MRIVNGDSCIILLDLWLRFNFNIVYKALHFTFCESKASIPIKEKLSDRKCLFFLVFIPKKGISFLDFWSFIFSFSVAYLSWYFKVGLFSICFWYHLLFISTANISKLALLVMFSFSLNYEYLKALSLFHFLLFVSC